MKRVVALLLLGCSALGCAEDPGRRGTLSRLPLQLGPLGYRPTATLAVSVPVERRPAIERAGAGLGTKLFFTVGVVTRWERAGNYVTDDYAASPDAVRELHEDALAALRAANVARAVVPSGAADFELKTEIEHLYGTRFAIDEGTVVLFAMQQGRGRRSTSMGNLDVVAKQRQYASYGNVVLRATLVDRRGPEPVAVWDEHVVGSAQMPPEKQGERATQTALRAAVADAMATLAVRVGAALDRLETGPEGPTYVLEGGLPPVFLIERVSRYRDFLERVFVETASGRVIRHEIVPNANRAYAKPGEWLLSRRTPEGVLLSAEGYQRFAAALARKYDLRTFDDAYRYHFFGVLGGATPAPRSSDAPVPTAAAREAAGPHEQVAVARGRAAVKVAGD